MAENTYEFMESEDIYSDIRSDREEEFFLNLRIKMDKRLVDELASHFGGKSGEEYPVEVRKLVGGRLPFDVYMANSSSESHPQSINMVLCTDTQNKYNSEIVNALDNMTLSIYGFNTPDWFNITAIRKVPAVVGTASNRVIRAEVVFFYNHSVEADNIGAEIVNRIFELPNIFDETKLINQRIAHWDEYLKINEGFAEEAQVLAEYSGYKKSSNISQLVFSVEAGKFTPAHNNSDIQLVLGVEQEYGHPVYKGPLMGTINNYNPGTCELTVDMSFEFMEMLSSGCVVIPRSAGLFVTKWGDLVQLRRLRYGLNTFARGQAHNRMLDVFIFDSSKARECTGTWEKIDRSELLHFDLNEEQHRAVEGVINSPDLYLIQGPPGTGKTTVISEICYQNAIRGLRTLIASQTNLAVDNALGKLVHHPKIRALRKGNEQSVQKEGKNFTENNVIKTWFDKTLSDCRGFLGNKNRLLMSVKEAEEKLDDIVNAYRLYNESLKKKTDTTIERAKSERQLRLVQDETKWLKENFVLFLENIKSEGYRNLTENPYNLDAEFVEKIKEFYVIKSTADSKCETYNGENENIKRTIRKFQGVVNSLKDSLNALKLKDSPELKSEKDFQREPVPYREWVAELKKVGTLIDEALNKKPLKILVSLGFGKKWPGIASDAINAYYSFKAVSRCIIERNLSEIDKFQSDPEIGRIFAELKAMTEAFLEQNRSRLEILREEFEKVDSELNESKKLIRSLRDMLCEYNYNIPYGAKTGELDEIRNMEDISSYYKNLWTDKSANDEKIASFVKSWTDRLSEGREADYKALKQLYISNANVIGITCSQSGSKEFTTDYPEFDVAIIDEVSKATPPELILSVLKAGKIVLVGDHKQLPPMVGADTYEEVAKKLEIPSEKIQHMKSSLFEELFMNAPDSLKTMLSTQYRMHSQIMDTINQFYIEENGYGLKCGLPDSGNQVRAHMCHGDNLGTNNHVIWVDVPMFEENTEIRSDVNYSYSNPAEIECIRNILLSINDNLEANGFEGRKKVGIISFYSNQVRLMENEFYSADFSERISKLSLRIGSVDRFQGIECPVVICSFVRNNKRGEIGFAKDPRRVNVALSRAQELSVIVGSSELFCNANKDSKASEIYKTISKYIYAHGGERSVWDFDRDQN